jgi:carbohydrate-selective porin OprB
LQGAWSGLTGKWNETYGYMQEYGINLGGGLVLDQSQVAFGGTRQRLTARGLLSLELTLNLKTLLGLEGGTFYVDYQTQVGRNASRDVGDIQMFSNIDANGRSQVTECWYEQ